MEKNQFTIIAEDGKELVFDVLFTFDSEETKKSYIVYTDNTKDETGNIKVYASTYKPDDPDDGLRNIETQKEWTVIETILNTLQEKIKEKTNQE